MKASKGLSKRYDALLFLTIPDRHNTTEAQRLYTHMDWGKKSFVVYVGTDSIGVYVYIGIGHKINSSYEKKSPFHQRILPRV